MIIKGALKGPSLSVENAISIVGWGNQAKAWGANLRDSGFQVNVLLRNDSPSKLAAEKVATVVPFEGNLPNAPIALLIPDHEIAAAVAQLAPRLPAGAVFLYAHGYALMDASLDEKFPQLRFVLFVP